MATAALIRHTPEEYFALEASAKHRSEYIDGQIIAMSPGAIGRTTCSWPSSSMRSRGTCARARAKRTPAASA